MRSPATNIESQKESVTGYRRTMSWVLLISPFLSAMWVRMGFSEFAVLTTNRSNPLWPAIAIAVANLIYWGCYFSFERRKKYSEVILACSIGCCTLAWFVGSMAWLMNMKYSTRIFSYLFLVFVKDALCATYLLVVHHSKSTGAERK